MKAFWIAALLVTAGLTGCLQSGEPLDAATTGTADGSEQTQPDHRSSGNGSAAGSNTSTEDGSNGESSSSSGDSTWTNGTDEQQDAAEGNESTDGNASGSGSGSSRRVGPTAFELNSSVEVGYLAAVGIEWIAPTEEAGAEGQNATIRDPGQTDAEHCPVANATVPTGSQQLAVEIQGEPVNGSPAVPPGGDPSTPSAAGAYTIVITAPDGSTTELSWAQGQAGDGAETNWTTSEPVPGNWTIEAEPEGPVVQQTWQVDLAVTGEALEPPTALPLSSTC